MDLFALLFSGVPAVPSTCIPDPIYSHPSLSDSAKLTFGVAAKLMGEDAPFPDEAQIAEALGRDEAHVRAALSELRTAQFIEQDANGKFVFVWNQYLDEWVRGPRR